MFFISVSFLVTVLLSCLKIMQIEYLNGGGVPSGVLFLWGLFVCLFCFCDGGFFFLSDFFFFNSLYLGGIQSGVVRMRCADYKKI